MTSAHQLREVRAHFDFPQPALGSWLGLSRSFLALVETGREALPAHARPWLRPLAAALALPDDPTLAAPAPFPEAPPLPTAGPAAVLARLRECDYQARRLHQQQAALLAAQRTAARRLAAGPLLLAALPAPAPTELTALALRRRWLARLLEAAADALAPAAPAGPVAAALLDARRRAWLHEATCLRVWLNDHPPTDARAGHLSAAPRP
ncbi:hypothetical protein F0P96_18095 [Hymenobacter busanensis]|uniref:Uncharacterized protein n=1 Tax=Hymenobacter busanensis TaxID=2607656 RepID=A0A7L4ZSH3_9BACT|nr:hypothetical protein [Hymenobacter busanensis]KAA9327148.1 hypothetical protein F0P96_18095 [Hymenobacter busanensis]QHJ05813.1 hypothetical protein GUY19_00290 [Hymenobacter busanensis]